MMPAAIHITHQKSVSKGEGPIVLILAPTRELAQQIQTVATILENSNIRTTCLFGGTPKGPQVSKTSKKKFLFSMNTHYCTLYTGQEFRTRFGNRNCYTW